MEFDAEIVKTRNAFTLVLTFCRARRLTVLPSEVVLTGLSLRRGLLDLEPHSIG
jgi:hypothetical protein